MTKDQDLGETIELGAATIETLGVGGSSKEIQNDRALPGMGICEDD